MGISHTPFSSIRMLAWGISAFLLSLFGMVSTYSWYVEAKKNEIHVVLDGYSDKLSKNLEAAKTVTISVAAYVSANLQAQNSSSAITVIEPIQLYRSLEKNVDFIDRINIYDQATVNKHIRAVDKNESQIPIYATKFDLERLIDRSEIAILGPVRIENGKTVFAFIYPVYYTSGNEEIYWGIVQCLVTIRKLVDASHLADLNLHGLNYQLGKRDINSGDQVFIYGHDSTDTVNQESINIALPEGTLILAVDNPFNRIVHFSYLIITVIALMIGLGVAQVIRQFYMGIENFRDDYNLLVEEKNVSACTATTYQEVLNSIRYGITVWNSQQTLEFWNSQIDVLYPDFKENLKKGITKWDDTAVSSWYQSEVSGVIHIKRWPMVGGWRIVMHIPEENWTDT